MAFRTVDERELELAIQLTEARLLPNGEWIYWIDGEHGYTKVKHHILEDWCAAQQDTTCCLCGEKTYGVPSQYIPGKGFHCDSCI